MLFVDIEVAVLAFVALWSHSPYDSLTVVAVGHLKIKIVSIHNKEVLHDVPGRSGSVENDVPVQRHRC